ncbi:MAG TPA: tail fiber domain-containing protein [Pyrinomonadaceae bacterium]|nr:tail fiber domain-containing protein [Pyrinomonadaceae bacterium]
MKNRRTLGLAVFAVLLIGGLCSAALGQTSEGNFANVAGGGSSVRFEVLTQHAGLTLTITAPDGRAFRKEFKAGALAEFSLTERLGLPDGTYTYELRLQPSLVASQQAALQKSRGKDDEPESERAARRRSSTANLVQSGSFAVLNGQVIVAGLSEGGRAKSDVQPVRVQPASARITSGNTVTRLRNHRLSLFSYMPDQVIPDDLIVQGSACVGLDCVNGENFGFDTIRMKENNTRLQFDDTSTSAGFATNNWQIRANSSSSGGGSFLAFVDQGNTGNSETGTIVFEVDAGAPANSLRVSSGGNIGVGTATPVLEVHVNTTDTPAMRFEQNNSGGFTAQTWDVAGNEANFFVRDVTSGSRLPLRIRPGAPTSSLDINASGNVGIGTAAPAGALHVLREDNADLSSIVQNTTGSDGRSVAFIASVKNTAGTQSSVSMEATAVAGTNANLAFRTGGSGTGFGTQRMIINAAGNVGIGTLAPTQLLSVNGTAGKPGGGTWDVFSDERLKNIKGRYTTGLKALMQLQPLRYEYKSNNPLGIKSAGEFVGFGAQSVQKIIPEAVTRDSTGYLMIKSDPIIWTMLNAIKEQQKEIEQLKGQIRKLQANSHRRRK